MSRPFTLETLRSIREVIHIAVHTKPLPPYNLCLPLLTLHPANTTLKTLLPEAKVGGIAEETNPIQCGLSLGLQFGFLFWDVTPEAGDSSVVVMGVTLRTQPVSFSHGGVDLLSVTSLGLCSFLPISS